MIKVVILDLDGPLLDGKLRHYQCYSDILLENGCRPMSIDRYWKAKRNKYDCSRQLAMSGAEEICDIFLKTWMDRIEEKKYLRLDRIQEGVVEKLTCWKSVGVKLVLATMRANRDNLYWQLNALGLSPFFDHIIIAEMINGNSNKAEKVRPYIKDVNVDSILWIGDTETDIHAARQIGVKVCAVSCGLRTFDYLSSLNPFLLSADINSINLSWGRL